MNNLKLICIAFVSFIALQTNAQDKNFSISIHPSKEQPKDAKVFVRYFIDRKIVIDSVKLNKDKNIYQGHCTGPTLVNLYYAPDGGSFLGRTRVQKWDKVNLYVDEGNTIVKFDNMIAEAEIAGSAIQAEYAHYAKFMQEFDKKLEDFTTRRSALYSQKGQDTKEFQVVASKLDSVNQEKDKAKDVYIRANPNSYFSLLALKDIAGYDINTNYIEPLLSQLSPKLKLLPEAVELANNIATAKRLSVGKVAPEFSQVDVSGKMVNLSDFKGKYVLLDFWASWCGPCRADNPNLVKAYEGYKDKNFTILGVSLDKPGKREDWLKAIEKDGLNWFHVSDLTGWDNKVAGTYGIRAIPMNFLIDPQGKIIAKNLHGNDLSTLLKKLL